MTRVLGMACSGHGTSVCLVEDGEIVRAVNLERLTRKKPSMVALPGTEEFLDQVWRREGYSSEAPSFFDFYEMFPRLLRYVTGSSRLSESGIDLVVKTPDNIARAPQLAPDVQPHLDAAYFQFEGYFAGIATHLELEHHLAHAYQAYLSSPFDDAAVLTIDGTGERLERLGFSSLSATLASGRDGRIRVLDEVSVPTSMGAVYSNVTRHLGFGEDQDGKTMALAALGSDRFYRENRDCLELADDGTFEFPLNDRLTSLRLLDRMADYVPRRARDEPISERHQEVARAAQRFCEDVVCNAASALFRRTGQRRLAIAGGVGLNCVANKKILENTPIEDVYVMPNAGDRGLAAGCALFGYHVLLQGTQRVPPPHDYLGRAYSEAEILHALRSTPGITARRCEDSAAEGARLVAGGAILGLFQGGAEFGPRALGNRSIVADPGTLASKRRLDNGIKRREAFRPYAPSVMEEHCSSYFDLGVPSPYMTLAAQVHEPMRERLAGIVHVDGSARVQTVSRDTNPRFHALIEAFGRETGTWCVLNTSFNRVGEPIVETPYDAIDCFLGTDLDALVLEDYLVVKEGGGVD